VKTPLSQKLEAGFALPIAVGVGIVMILIATTMVIRSNQSQVASISQRSNHKSLAAAETGVAQYMALFNEYRGFLTSNLEDWDDKRSELQFRQVNSCSSGGATPDPNYSNGDVTKFFDPAPDVDNRWTLVDSSTPEKGRFRIINYEVNPTLTLGTMTLEGSDRDSTSARTRLEVSFPIVATTPPVPSVNANTSSPPGCPFSAMELPINQSLNAFVQATENESSLNILNVAKSYLISSTISPNPANPKPSEVVLPRSGDEDVENYTYVINGNPAVNLGADETLRIEDNKTVILVTENNIDVNGGQILLGNNSKLFIVSAANVTLTQRAGADRPVVFSNTVNQPAASEAFQIFLTGIDADPSNPGDSQGELTITVNATSYPANPPANETTLSFVAYAPDGSVRFNKLASSQTGFAGAVWAKNFSLSPDPPAYTRLDRVGPPPRPLPLFWQGRLDLSQISKRLSSINSWKKLELP
jgi:type II secretory pathway pseudopilin PulG